jgi:hypothetical protein
MMTTATRMRHEEIRAVIVQTLQENGGATEPYTLQGSVEHFLADRATSDDVFHSIWRLIRNGTLQFTSKQMITVAK